MGFHKLPKRKEPITKYDQDEYFVKKGKKIFIKEFTKLANEDCEIYPTLEKYGLTTPEQLPEKMFDNQAFVGDLEDFKDLRTSLDRQIKAKQMWENLPLSIRDKFGHDINRFVDESPKFLEELKSKIQEQQAPKIVNETPKEEGTNAE